jgi:hypothetical protein
MGHFEITTSLNIHVMNLKVFWKISLVEQVVLVCRSNTPSVWIQTAIPTETWAHLLPFVPAILWSYPYI